MKGEKKTEFKSFSKKQMQVLTWWHPRSPYQQRDAIICDGAVRSGKTLSISLSFVLWAFSRFRGESFAICGKTITSLRRNLVRPLIGTLQGLGFACREKVSEHYVDIERGGEKNRFYLFGGKDESSASLIQGITLAGILLDEVALMPRSFVEQALARCSVPGSKFWFSCNPEYPGHWFYTEWILKRKEKNVLYLRFRLEDNPSLTGEIVRRYKALYTGRFYERFIEGKWIQAEGIIYPMFRESRHVVEPPAGGYNAYYISCDYGTVNPASFGLWGERQGVYYRIREYYHDSRREGLQKTDEEYYKELVGLAAGLPVRWVVCDPSAASFMACIRKQGDFKVLPAKNNVQSGIQKVSAALGSGRIKIGRTCADAIREFHLYRWDIRAQGDVPLKENDHAMDDIRYFVSTLLDRPEDPFVAISVSRGGQGGKS